jgi:hypothetical protein
MRTPIVNAANVSWRAIGGIDFQVIAPYVLVAKPNQLRSTWVWLRKERGAQVWEAYVTPAGAPAEHPVALDASAAGALAIAMALPLWDEEVDFKPTAPVPTPVWSYPEARRSYRHWPGDYADRATAHDSRWDWSRSGRAS